MHGRCYRLPGAAAQCPQLPRAPAEPGRRADRHDFNGTGARADHHAAAPVRSVSLSASVRGRCAAAGRLALALIILLACALAAGSWRVYSNTWDEPEHLAAGIELLDRGQYEYDTEHPPLGRVLLALGPYLAGARSFGTPPPNGTQEGIDILYSGGHYWRYLTLARAGVLPFLALLLLGTWLWARRLFASQGAALLSVLLLASVPAVLGHAALASLDVAAAATCLLALYALQLWLVSGRLRGPACRAGCRPGWHPVRARCVRTHRPRARARVCWAWRSRCSPPCCRSHSPMVRARPTRQPSRCVSTGRCPTCCRSGGSTMSSVCCSRICGCRARSGISSTASWRSRLTTTAVTCRTCWDTCASWGGGPSTWWRSQ
ncbi:MAG: phospholipid carrier-dependent glycosyltransferase [Gammaproteobacteria bacterium]|nr:MAG: phospholipid carrier-dependent glycosyltransferase [Gammaproteobacteria bacterium]